MRVVAFIAEYNPFHYGHKYHLEESLSLTGASHSIALMSGSFVQRGEPALVDKWTRAKMALDNGIDLVLELPFVYSCQSAEFFAHGAISIINALKVVDYISFGSELGNLDALKIISDILAREPQSYRECLKKHLAKGYSYAVSRSKALISELEHKELISNYSIENILKGSNNILSIEYLKSLTKLSSKVKPITISRLGDDYKSLTVRSNIASATAIRETIIYHGLASITNLVPKQTAELLSEFYNKYNIFNGLANYELIIRYLLMTKNKDYIGGLLDIESGLENRIVEKSREEKNIVNLINLVSTKRYPRTRIQRILIHLLNDIDKNTIKELYSYPPQYIRVLAANVKGLEILSQIKKQSNINIISKFSSYKKLNNQIINKFLHFEEKATDIYFWGLNNDVLEANNDFYTSPYIKKL